MEIDPTTNVVVFIVKHRDEQRQAVGHAPARAADSVRTAWKQVQMETGAGERQVQQIYSEWEPAPEEMRWIARHFPSAEVSYSFARPTDGNWEQAFEEVERIMREAAIQEAADEIRQNAPLLPVLRNKDEFSDVVASRPVIPELALFLAHVGPTPHGTIGFDYVMRHRLRAESQDENVLWEQAFGNLTEGLKVKVAGDENAKLILLERENGFAASAIGLPGFAEQAASFVEGTQILVAIHDPDTLLLCREDSPHADRIRDIVLKSDYDESVNLTPTLLLLKDGQLSLAAQRPQGTSS